ncbi:MAG: recombinase family protein [Terriglobia bacterium]
MAKVERIRELVKRPLEPAHLKQKEDAGWILVALEWQRPLAGEKPLAEESLEEVSYGLRVAGDCLHLEEEPVEMHALMLMMELIVQDYPLSKVASTLNQQGFRTRMGAPWSPVTVFNMLPRLIDVGPKMFSTGEWEERRRRLARAV